MWTMFLPQLTTCERVEDADRKYQVPWFRDESTSDE